MLLINKKNRYVIALDFDDCILPSDQNYFGNSNDSLELLEINLKRLILIVEKYGIDIFIISSWSSSLNYIKSKRTIEYIQHDITNLKTYYEYEEKAFNIIEKYLNGYISGISENGKYYSLNRLINLYFKVIIIEDSDFSEFEKKYKNCIFCKTEGYISGRNGYKIHAFIENDIKWNSSY